MDENLKQQLTDMLKGLADTAQQGATWAKGEIPLLVQEKIALGRAWETSLAGCLIIVVIVGLFLFRWAIKQYRASDSYGDRENYSLIASLATVGAIASAILFVTQLYYVYMVWFAPRLYIVEWLLGLINKGGN